MIKMNENTREMLGKVMDLGKKALHIGWIPMILYIGFNYSTGRPSILKVISPFAA